MPVPTFTKLGPKPDFNDVVNKLNTLVGELTNLMLNMDSLNVVELTANHITAGTIDASIVTIRSDLSSGAYVKIDGNGMVINDGTKNTFTADILGKVTMTGAVVRSAAGTYPLVIMDPASQLFGAYAAADKNVRIEALNGTSSSPTVVFKDGSMSTLMYNDALAGEFSIVSINGFQISVSGDLRLYGSRVRVGGWNSLFSDSANGGLGQTLQQALDAKANTSALAAKADVSYVNGFGINLGFDPGTRNLKLYAANGSTLATVNIP